MDPIPIIPKILMEETESMWFVIVRSDGLVMFWLTSTTMSKEHCETTMHKKNVIIRDQLNAEIKNAHVLLTRNCRVAEQKEKGDVSMQVLYFASVSAPIV